MMILRRFWLIWLLFFCVLSACRFNCLVCRLILLWFRIVLLLFVSVIVSWFSS